MDNYWELKKQLPNAENQEAVREFLLNLKIANRSRLTVMRYRWFLERFFGDMHESYTKITSDCILEWFNKKEGNLKEATLRFRFSILASFYNFCIKEYNLERSPIKRRWFPRLPQPVPKYLGKEEIAKTRQQIEKNSLRNQVLVEFMLASGCRVAEVHQLDRREVDLENRTARIIGKGKKVRQVHFTDRCALLLEKYLNSRQDDSSALFVTSTGRRLSIRMMQQVMNNIGKEMGMVGTLHPHRLRHTFATEFMAKGAELSFIGAELGHSDLKTTQIYARLPKKEIISLYRKYMG